jgi:hypothetical protein
MTKDGTKIPGGVMNAAFRKTRIIPDRNAEKVIGDSMSAGTPENSRAASLRPPLLLV